MSTNWLYWRRLARRVRDVAERNGVDVVGSSRPQILRFHGPIEGAAYFRIDGTGDHSWGFTKGVESYLREGFERWAFVPVDAANGKYYVLPRETVEEAIEGGLWSESENQWHIHSQGRAPKGSRKLGSVEELFDHLSGLFRP